MNCKQETWRSEGEGMQSQEEKESKGGGETERGRFGREPKSSCIPPIRKEREGNQSGREGWGG